MIYISAAEICMRNIEITAVEPSRILSEMIQRSIVLRDVRYVDEFRITAMVNERDIAIVTEVTECFGGDCKTVHRPYWSVISQIVPKRMLLILSVSVIFLLTVLIPTRILFVKIIGNSLVPTNLILTKAEECGISFWSDRKTIRNEQIKNYLISTIPQLRWVGVNTHGCVAEITVSEKDNYLEVDEADSVVSNIVASRDGVVVSKTILQGTDICTVGQAVLKGELLVSGYIDCGLVIQATDAQAEILAQTKRNLYAISPALYWRKGELLDTEKRYSLVIGKNLIKLYKDSGISGAGCDKIYKRDYMQLPGGYTLPVGIVTEQIDYYRTYTIKINDFGWMNEFSNAYLKSQMVAGKIVAADELITENATFACLNGRYECIEMIGKKILEENIDTYGVSN